jgi:hypothetical protein
LEVAGGDRSILVYREARDHLTQVAIAIDDLSDVQAFEKQVLPVETRAVVDVLVVDDLVQGGLAECLVELVQEYGKSVYELRLGSDGCRPKGDACSRLAQDFAAVRSDEAS